jgi:hypothetical protein
MRRLFLSLVVFLTFIACSTSTVNISKDGNISESDIVVDTYSGINLEALPNFSATYSIDFEGDYTWRYTLVTRFDGELTEYFLHIEGVDPVRNPGDIRLVTDGETSWMTGPGVDNDCFMFPDDMDVGPAFLSPDDILAPQKVTTLLSNEGEEEIESIQTTHYVARADAFGGLSNLRIDLWLSSARTALMYTLQASGGDPVFDAGEGRLNANFMVIENAPMEIEPVPGCEIDLPLLIDAERVVRFPRLISFETGASPYYVIDFYHDYLIEEGWKVDDPLTETDTNLQISYARGKETLVLIVNVEEDIVTVKILQQ